MGLILVNKSLASQYGRGKSRVMLIKFEKEDYLDIFVSLDYSEKDRWDLLQASDKILNKLKRDLINAWKMKEK